MSWLDRSHSIAPPGFNRWLIPPAALAVHLCIGQAYATSVYKTALVEHFGTSQTAIGVVFSIAIPFLILSEYDWRSVGVFGALVGCALLGFTDDYIKIVRRRSLGLSARMKLGVTILISIGLWWIATREANLAETLRFRLIVAAILTAPIFVVEMGGHLIPAVHHWTMSVIGEEKSIISPSMSVTGTPRYPPSLLLINSS